MLKPPVFGPLFHKVALARMTRTLASLIGSGVPILESLGHMRRYSRKPHRWRCSALGQGGCSRRPAPGRSLREHEDIIPTLVVQMIEVGEQTGALDGMLRRSGSSTTRRSRSP